jgi:peptidyl-prolyl cis-trans isomerase SurA
MVRKIKNARCATLILYVCSVWVGLYSGIAGAELVDRIVAVVNDDIILLSDLEETISPMRAALEKEGYSLAAQERMIEDRRDKILEQMIHDKLTDQQARRLNLKVADEEVDATIERIRSANRLSDDELRRALELDGMTYESYRTQIKEQMLRARLVNRQVKSKIVITDNDVKAYYDANIETYTGRVKYHLRHILLKVAVDADPSEKARVRDQFNVIRERLQAGEPFEKLAELFSEAPTASQGGQLGVFGTHLLTEEIRQALEGLQAKEFSEVVETDQGYQMFYVEDIISSGGKTLEEATPEIRDKLYADVVDKKFKTWIEDLRKKSHIQILDE